VQKKQHSYGFKVNQFDPSKKIVIDPLLYSTYIGGESIDQSESIFVDSTGCAYITGWTYSSDFPITNAFDTLSDNTYDAFVLKLSATGDSLVYATYIGGGGSDYGHGLYVDSSGFAYITGETQSRDFPTVNAYQHSYKGGSDAFVVKLAPSGDSILYSTYFGGSYLDFAQNIWVNSTGYAYVTGYTGSFDFPVKNAVDSALNGDFDAFIFNLDDTGSSLVYSTYIGGSDTEHSEDIFVDALGNAYITGWTYSSDFPTVNANDATLNGIYDAFVVKLSLNGSTFLYATYIGGNSIERSSSIYVDSLGCAYITGY
ncbi:MAG: SBBP repeat-containing protein, partial [Candidatus Hodarchaeota archaeon]